MQATLVEDNEKGRRAYSSLIVSEPKSLAVLNNKLALKIIKSLSESPAPAIDIARKLKVHEQKIYYHIRKLEKAGIIYTISNEKRHGMIAKIYTLIAPVIATKLHDNGVDVKETVQKETYRFFEPFIEDGELDAKIIVSDPYPHGETDLGGAEAPHTIDFMLFLGSMINKVNFPTYKLDTEIRNDDDLKTNLILFGNLKTNSVIRKFNDTSLPIFFDTNKGDTIVSKLTRKTYEDPRIGYICKMPNPMKKDKYILIIGGVRSRGVKAAVITITQHINNLEDEEKRKGGTIVKVVQGLDRDSDTIIDSIKFLE